MANGLPRESIGYYTGLGKRILVELNPNILVRDAIIMSGVAWSGVTAGGSYGCASAHQKPAPDSSDPGAGASLASPRHQIW